MLLQSLHDSEVELAEGRTPREHQRCVSKTVSGLREKGHFLLQRKLGALGVVDELDALDNLVMILLNKAFRSVV